MPDFRIADTAPEHRKLRAAGLAATGLWALAGAYAMRELTDGWVPDHWVRSWPAGRRHAGTLVRVGLWIAERRDGLDGYAYHDWLAYQRSRVQIQSEQHAASTRRQLYTSPGLAAAVKLRDGDRCRYCGRTVHATDRRTVAGATLDYVTPLDRGGPNALDNVVVACRGCSAAKRGRTPEQAGMTLLPPPTEPSSELVPQPDPNQKKSKPPVPTPSSIQDLGGVSYETQRAPARGTPPNLALTSENDPQRRCPQHREFGAVGVPCRACAAHRQRAEKEATHVRLQQVSAVRACAWCDGDGWRIDPAARHRGPLPIRCDHTPPAGGVS